MSLVSDSFRRQAEISHLPFAIPIPHEEMEGGAENKQLSELQNRIAIEEAPSSKGSYLAGLASYGASAIGFAALNSYAMDHIAPALAERGFCFSNLISVSSIQNYRSFLNPIFKIPHLINNLFFGQNPNQFFRIGVLAPICEEVEFRYLLQHVLLKKIPQHILEKVAPDYADMIDKWPIQVLRAFTVAVLFTIGHTQAMSCEDWGGIPQFIGGLLYGLLTEYNNGDITLTINLHMINNMMAMLLG
ncbi:MAG: CPBP family intramembrane metalloprotease [Verrucomicrobia bacterium]|nr:CPBP family intramembrane metalloprotease [Verrucomicrobiota bacterium]